MIIGVACGVMTVSSTAYGSADTTLKVILYTSEYGVPTNPVHVLPTFETLTIVAFIVPGTVPLLVLSLLVLMMEFQ